MELCLLLGYILASFVIELDRIPVIRPGMPLFLGAASFWRRARGSASRGEGLGSIYS
jgi:hypothetical protein